MPCLAMVGVMRSLVMIVHGTKKYQLPPELFCLPSVKISVYYPTITADRATFSYLYGMPVNHQP